MQDVVAQFGRVSHPLLLGRESGDVEGRGLRMLLRVGVKQRKAELLHLDEFGSVIRKLHSGNRAGLIKFEGERLGRFTCFFHSRNGTNRQVQDPGLRA